MNSDSESLIDESSTDSFIIDDDGVGGWSIVFP